MTIEREIKELCRNGLKQFPSLTAAELVGFIIKPTEIRIRLMQMTGSDAEYFVTLLVREANKMVPTVII